MAQLQEKKHELDRVKSEIGMRRQEKVALEHEITDLEGSRDLLNAYIQAKEQKVSNLKELESKHDQATEKLAQMEARVKREEKRWAVFESLLGLVQSSSLTGLKEFAQQLPDLVDAAEQKKYSPIIMRRMIFNELGVTELSVLKCNHCEVKFTVNKALRLGNYCCPYCGFNYYVVVDKDAATILKAALAATKPQETAEAQWVLEPKKSTSKNKDTG